MRKKEIGILLFGFYCFPFVYFSMYQDFENRTMIGYLMMIAATSFLAFFGRVNNFTLRILLGNIASAISSFYFSRDMAGNVQWGGYFKPFTPERLVLVVTLLNLLPQLFAIKTCGKFNKRSSRLRKE